MRKIDRLFEIIQLLRGQRLRTAEFIADKLGVSARTIYRDIQGLVASGIPVEGERGIGYIIRQPIDMPPLHFTALELRALLLGIDMVRAVSDQDVSAAAQEAAVKIRDALPISARTESYSPLAHIYFESDVKTRDTLTQVRNALDDRKKIKFHYTNESMQSCTRSARPLGLEYWGKVWTLTAWCELREDFRVFRVDRIESCVILPEHFACEPGKTYRDYLRQHSDNEP